MDSRDLTDAQLTALKNSLGQHIRYMHKLVERMEKLGWDRNDGLYRAAVRAKDTAGALSMELHYAGCAGVGKAGRKAEQ